MITADLHGNFPAAPASAALLEEALDALLELTGATAGWAGVPGPDDRLTFPARRGRFPDNWLHLQQGQVPFWGFEVRGGPSLLNRLPALPALGEPALHNLLSCHLSGFGMAAGQVVLANKPNGFTEHDATLLQGVAHLLGKHLGRPAQTPAPLEEGVLQYALDRVGQGVLVLGATGALLHANATWLQWTGFAWSELRHRRAPFPFWVSHCDLAADPWSLLLETRSAQPGSEGDSPEEGSRRGGVVHLPFQQRDGTVFWCQVETFREEFEGQTRTVAVLHRLPAPATAVFGAAGQAKSLQALADDLPFAVALTDGLGRVVWGNTNFLKDVSPGGKVLGQPLGNAFTSSSARAVEQVVQEEPVVPGRTGCLTLEQTGMDGKSVTLIAPWLAVGKPEDPGVLFALAAPGNAPWFAGEPQAVAAAPAQDVNWLPLLCRPGGEIAFWDDRWERLTGLTARDLAGVTGEVVLDWLFPRQRDRDFVADLLHQPPRGSAHAVLDVLGRGASEPLPCTFVPLRLPPAFAAEPGSGGTNLNAWLLLVGLPMTGSPAAPAAAGEAGPIRQAAGLQSVALETSPS